ncbi:acyl-CoA thioesterase [Marinifilum sp. D737]|uniref:acyl-CoA thioesterase n=1 Tax=Marinifilum sp. D737 TaxID=2969628 RepID=UPI002273F054|nr:acyl-CoA thioesterase [Marinifilum sp. D737]MCY1636359.1 acyl-CoA thioesterase [Marinifilum sp. D737]
MIEGECRIRPRYGEVDQMGYVYHANYVDYCHFARTELMRSFGINDKVLEENGIMMPVIEMNLKYKKPTGYDEELLVITRIPEIPLTRFKFNFEFRNQNNELVCKANSTLAFVKSDSRKPIKAPEMVLNSLKEAFVM